jgi:hypothetical protein
MSELYRCLFDPSYPRSRKQHRTGAGKELQFLPICITKLWSDFRYVGAFLLCVSELAHDYPTRASIVCISTTFVADSGSMIERSRVAQSSSA